MRNLPACTEQFLARKFRLEERAASLSRGKEAREKEPERHLCGLEQGGVSPPRSTPNTYATPVVSGRLASILVGPPSPATAQASAEWATEGLVPGCARCPFCRCPLGGTLADFDRPLPRRIRNRNATRSCRTPSPVDGPPRSLSALRAKFRQRVAGFRKKKLRGNGERAFWLT